MDQRSILTGIFSDLAATIRTKGGTSEEISPYEMRDAILSLESATTSSGVNPMLINKTISNYYNSAITNYSLTVFQYNSNIKRICMPACISINTSGAFEGCSNLQLLSLRSLQQVNGRYWISDCSKLLECSFPYLTIIPSFQGGRKLISYYAPCASIVSAAAFNDCTYLTSLQTSVLTTVYYSAFRMCTNLESVTLSTSPSIDQCAFMSCFKLRDLGIDVFSDYTTLQYSAFQSDYNLPIGTLFDFNQYIYYLYPSCLELAGISTSSYSFSISNLSIASGMYSYPFGWSRNVSSYFPNLQNVYIGESVTEFYLFLNGLSLNSVFIESNIQGDIGFFNNTISSLTIKDRMDIYLSSCSIGRAYFSYVRNMPLNQIRINSTFFSFVSGLSFSTNYAYMSSQNMYYLQSIKCNYCVLDNVYNTNPSGISLPLNLCFCRSNNRSSAALHIQSSPSISTISFTQMTTAYGSSLYSLGITVKNCLALSMIYISIVDCGIFMNNTPADLIENTNISNGYIYITTQNYRGYNQLLSWARGTALYSRIYSY